MKPLKCSPKAEDGEPHLCIGVCGEDCIDVCRICDAEKFFGTEDELDEEGKLVRRGEDGIRSVFFGTEEEEGVRFVQLKDCGHVFEMTVREQSWRMRFASVGSVGSQGRYR